MASIPNRAYVYCFSNRAFFIVELIHIRFFFPMFVLKRGCATLTIIIVVIGEAAAPEVLRRDQPRHGQVLLHG